MTILVFTGAGASAAISPKRFLTTSGFLNNLDKETKNKISSIVNGSLIQYIKQKRDPFDIEDVLWSISEFREYCKEANNPEEALFRIIETTYPALMEIMKSFNGELRELEHSINTKVYDIYGHTNFSKAEGDKLTELANFIKMLQNIYTPVELFTTNYDLILDSISHDSNLNIFDCKASFYASRVLQYPKPGEAVDGNGRLTKLHGSIDWHIEGDRIIATGSPYYTGDDNKHLIIYPGFKGKPTHKYFVDAHDHLREITNKAKAAVFIGFSFRDEYINSILSEISANIPKFIINKSKDDERKENTFIPFAKEKCAYSYVGLTGESMTKCLQYIDGSIQI